MSSRNKHRVLTRSNKKTIIQHGELTRILNASEIMQWHHIISKIERFDEKEEQRLKI
ncbi:hypothetical protein FH508_0012295 [Lysinibacillus sp. CD3-6]|uniref:hypothetical protein n=1 Tax=Lysinibacillus sp. CD3-6 TaxID=2892541 RepID=UPI00155E1570|nr:hypothetical protein [Lysinibacillus sp. CD3-6]UED78249.1 hypothetical protein FH508_0012295 [Lysinibacillus sp. CD3-6]